MLKHYFLFPVLVFLFICPPIVFSGVLSDTPLSLKATVPPNVLFALSVEFPTANTAAYQSVVSNNYTKTSQYLGLFDPDKCYDYDSGNGWFYPVALTEDHTCSSSRWSGNFLNWATMTGLDEFRFAMTGGNRYRDTATVLNLDGTVQVQGITVLERVWQDGHGGTANFQDKTFSLSNSNFVGALPYSLTSVTGSILNQGKGVQMLVTATMPTTLTCTTWKTVDPKECTAFAFPVGFDRKGSTATVGCSTWTIDSSRKSCKIFSFSSSAFGESIASPPTCNAYVGGDSTKHCLTYNVTYTANPMSGSNFNVRVKVCDSTVGLENNCKQYGINYKPTGVLQDNGDKMRFGVFSYFNDNSINNAVMRSKLKYVAPQQYASSIGTTYNANREWSETDGTLIDHPDGAVESAYCSGLTCYSGVINYINKFGSFGSSGLKYKTYDNVSKLYYEALAYLRNRSYDTVFYAGAATTANDPFPVVKWTAASDDPLLFSCQKNYIITMGDTHTHCDRKLPGGAYASSTCDCGTDSGSLSNGDTLNVNFWTNQLGNLEGKPTNWSKTATPPRAACASYYISGLAYWAKGNDIRPADNTKPQTLGNQTVKTFIIDVQEYGEEGINTSQYWYAAKYGGADSFINNAPQGWTNDTVITSSSWPKTLLKAGDPVSMIAAVQSAFQSIRAGIGVESALAQSSGDLRTAGGAYIYQAIFNSGGWIGDVLGYSIDSTGTVSPSATWKASDWFARIAYSPNDRRLFSFNDGLQADGTAETGTSFPNSRKGIALPQASLTNLTLFSTRQQSWLNKDEVGVADTKGVARVNYLRGETSNEGRSGYRWRARLGKLGDIINSSPAFVGDPLPGLIGHGYGAFRQTYAGRKPMLYVGSNDGFLHGFDASAPGTQGVTPGQELFAYIPSALYPTLNQLMSANYAHKFYADGNPVVSEACFGSCLADDGSDWKTVLTAGLNAGGQGIYALNVTNPGSFASVTGPNLVLWEFTDRDDVDLGYTFGEPIIRKMNNGKWAVIFGNGYNNTASDGRVSATGRAYLYIVFVDGPSNTDKTWTRNTDYYKIELIAAGDTYQPNLPANNPPNGLSAPVGVDKTLNGTVDLIYAGDRLGNIWKIDVSSATPSSWGVALGSTSLPKPLFTAKDSLGNIQQITSSVELSRHPQGGFMVYFGTGSYIDTTDPLPESGSTFNKQTFYGIWDKDNLKTSTEKTNFTTIARSQLQGQTVVGTWASGGDTFYIMSNCQPNYGSAAASTFQLKADGRTADYSNCPSDIAQTNASPQSGWRFDLPSGGERMIADRPLVQGGVVTFTTLTPADDPCTGNTVGRMYDIDYKTGGRVSRGAAGVYDINNDKTLDSNDKFQITALGATSVTSTWVAPSGKQLIAGASETPLRLRLPDGSGPSGIGWGGGGSVAPSTVTATGGCSDFVSGWGCMSSMGRKPMGGNFMDFVSNQKLGGDGLLTSGNNIDVTAKSIPTLSGRVSWREIMR